MRRQLVRTAAADGRELLQAPRHVPRIRSGDLAGRPSALGVRRVRMSENRNSGTSSSEPTCTSARAPDDRFLPWPAGSSTSRNTSGSIGHRRGSPVPVASGLVLLVEYVSREARRLFDRCCDRPTGTPEFQNAWRYRKDLRAAIGWGEYELRAQEALVGPLAKDVQDSSCLVGPACWRVVCHRRRVCGSICWLCT
jgi:hypothetical protein